MERVANRRCRRVVTDRCQLVAVVRVGQVVDLAVGGAALLAVAHEACDVAHAVVAVRRRVPARTARRIPVARTDQPPGIVVRVVVAPVHVVPRLPFDARDRPAVQGSVPVRCVLVAERLLKERSGPDGLQTRMHCVGHLCPETVGAESSDGHKAAKVIVRVLAQYPLRTAAVPVPCPDHAVGPVIFIRVFLRVRLAADLCRGFRCQHLAVE